MGIICADSQHKLKGKGKCCLNCQTTGVTESTTESFILCEKGLHLYCDTCLEAEDQELITEAFYNLLMTKESFKLRCHVCYGETFELANILVETLSDVDLATLGVLASEIGLSTEEKKQSKADRDQRFLDELERKEEV